MEDEKEETGEKEERIERGRKARVQAEIPKGEENKRERGNTIYHVEEEELGETEKKRCRT